MKKVLTLALYLLFVACSEDEEMPNEVTYASRNEPFVYNLKRLDPDIASKTVEISPTATGNVRVVLNNNYLIFEPDKNFETTVLSIQIDGGEVISLVLIEARGGCVPLARSYELETSTKASPLTQELYTVFCDENLVSRVTSFTNVVGIEGTDFNTSYNYPPLAFTCSFLFTPQDGITGQGEIIYEVGADEEGYAGPPFAARQTVAGLIRIKVIG